MILNRKKINLRNKTLKYIFLVSFFSLVPTIGCLNPIKTSAMDDIKEEVFLKKLKNSIEEKKNTYENTKDKTNDNKIKNNETVDNNTKNRESQKNEQINIDEKTKEKLDIIRNKDKDKNKYKDFNVTISIIDDKGAKKEKEISHDEYIIGVVANEIGFNILDEAIKLCAVIANTYATYRCGINKIIPIGNTFQTYMPKEKRIKQFGAERENEVEKMLIGGEFTRKVLCDKYGNPIETLYDGCVGKGTNSSQFVWGNHRDYLQGVVSSEWKFYEKIIKVPVNNRVKVLTEMIKKVHPNLSDSEISMNANYLLHRLPKIKTTVKIDVNKILRIVEKEKKQKGKPMTNIRDDIKVINYHEFQDEKGNKYNFHYVDKMNVFGIEVSGEFMRRNLKLPSSSFEIEGFEEVIDNKTGIKNIFAIFGCYGNGHGLGVSQLGALIYALLEGLDYTQILQHYYSNKITIKSLEDLNDNILIKQ